MLDVLQFIFSSFWIWLGTVILLIIPFWGLAKVIRACRRHGVKNSNC
jgi:hypothetical protein